MNLYDRDYTVLEADEEARWKLLQQQEVGEAVGTRQLRTRWFRDCPKAVRHFTSLFPNNYLDIVELKDESQLNRQLNHFRNLIASEDVAERDILDFIHQHRAYFIVASLLKSYFPFGHHDAYLFREFQLGNSFQVDFLLAGKNSGGWNFVFVEFEAPTGQVTLKNGDLGSVFRKGLSQVTNWDAWLESRYGSLTETFEKHRRCDMCLPREFIALDKTRINYVVVAGRRTDFNDRTYRQRRTMQKDNSVLILHYDDIVDAAQRVIGEFTY
jgi:hypothetical protein